MVGRRRLALSLTAASFVATSGVPVPPVARAAAPCDREQVGVETLSLEVHALRLAYRLGATARISIEVTRQGEPVSGVWVASAFKGKKQTFLYGTNNTGVRGKTVVSIKLRRRAVKPGPVTLRSYAQIRRVDTVCAVVYEYGFERTRRAFVVRRP